MSSNISTTMSNWSATAGSNQPDSTDLASTLREDLQAIQAAVVTVFPGMAGAAWRHQAKSGDYSLAATDAMTILTCTGTITITTTAAASISGFMCLVKNAGTGVVTIGGIGYPPNSFVMIRSNGSAVSTETLSGPVFLARGSAAATNVTITGLSATAFSAYKLYGRNVTVTAGEGVVLRLGSGSIDTGNNYSQAVIGRSSGGVDKSSANEGVSFISLSNIMGNGTELDFELTLFNTASANNTRTIVQSNFVDSSADYCIFHGAGTWSGSSGADRLMVKGSTSDLVGGTFLLYGIP